MSLKYAIIGMSRTNYGASSKYLTKRHYGIISVRARPGGGSHTVKSIEISLLNKYNSGEIDKRNERIIEKVIKAVNDEYKLEDLQCKNKNSRHPGFRKMHKIIPKGEYNGKEK